MNKSLLAGALLALLVVGTAAQPHTEGWTFLASPNNAFPVMMGTVDLAGKLSTLLTMTSLPASTVLGGGVMDEANKNFYVAYKSKSIPSGVLVVDSTGSVIETIGVPGGFIADMAVDQDGNLLVLREQAPNVPAALLKIDLNRNITSVVSGIPLSFPTAITIDADSGDFIVLDRPIPTTNVIRISPDGQNFSLVGQIPIQASTQITQDVATGDYYAGVFVIQPPAATIMRLTQTGSLTTFLTGNTSTFAVHADRSSASARRLAVGDGGAPGGILFVDLGTKAVTTLFTAGGLGLTHVFPYQGRNIGTQLLSPGKWEIALHFPGEAGNAYVVAPGITGTKPGVPLGDGRRIPLNPDFVTQLALAGLLPPLFTGHTGFLKPNDRAVAFLDVSSIALGGVRLWVSAVTLGQSGIKTIADPAVVNL